jgi:glutamate formiminotransferase
VRLLESVPNFSEGRDQRTIDAIADELNVHARLLDVHSDPDHNRSVFTLVGDDRELVEALVGAVWVAKDRIDLRAHEGAHPRIGVADVVPIVPIEAGDFERARTVAGIVGERLGSELDLPVFLYAPPERGPAYYRRGGLEELQRRIDEAELAPDFGPNQLAPADGGVIVGARRPLIAFNVNLRGEVAVARAIAGLVREAGGGFPGVRALGLELASAGLVQVSMNVEDWEAAALHEIVARIALEAEARGAQVMGSELVGLMPAGAAAAAAGAALQIHGFDESHVLELRLLQGLDSDA